MRRPLGSFILLLLAGAALPAPAAGAQSVPVTFRFLPDLDAPPIPDVVRAFQLRSDRWGFDPEVTAKVLKRGHRIYEIPISYAGREFHEGKKITWKDGFRVFFALLRYRVWD